MRYTEIYHGIKSDGTGLLNFAHFRAVVSNIFINAGASIPPLLKGKGEGFPYSIPSVGPRDDPSVQAVSPQVTVSYPPGGRLPLLSTRPAVTSPAAEHHCPLACTKLYCLGTEAHRCEQLAQGCCAALPRVGFQPATY